MKTKTVLILAVILGLFTYTLPLYAANNNEYHIEEQTVIEIPIIGKISTLTSTHLSGCKLKENTIIKSHNTLVKMMSESDGKSQEILLSDMCEEVQWKYDENQAAYRAYSFDEIKQLSISDEDSETHSDMGSDQNDIGDLPKMVRNILGYEKNINGFKARKVVTTVYPEDSKNRIIIEEYYTTNARALSKISSAREDLIKKLDREGHQMEGVPNLVDYIYKSIREDKEWSRPDGDVVRFVIRLLDDDEDPIFSMKYDVLKAETTKFQADHFALK